MPVFSLFFLQLQKCNRDFFFANNVLISGQYIEKRTLAPFVIFVKNSQVYLQAFIKSTICFFFACMKFKFKRNKKMKEEENETIAKLKRKILIYSIIEVVIVIVLILFGAFLFNITFS